MSSSHFKGDKNSTQTRNDISSFQRRPIIGRAQRFDFANKQILSEYLRGDSLLIV